ncbi:MAG: Dabb family protein [Gammaproteobacteria bacterium]
MQMQVYLAVFLTLFITTGTHGVAKASATSSKIEHVVLCWLENPGKENRDRVIETVRELTAIPGVMDLRVGPVLPSDREVVDDSFDVGISMSFRNRREMEQYLNHEEHVRRLQEVFLPLCKDIRVYDFSF